MLFNSFEFLLFFLPISIIFYFLIIKWGKLKLARYWLLCASLFFYSWWNPIYLPLIVASILVNYFIGRELNKANTDSTKKSILWGGVILNIGLLGYFKYFNFFINNVNLLLQNEIHVSQIILPLGISFFTFQQVAYLVDSYYGKTKEYDFVSYSLFVTFFPQLIAGPIVHHKDVMPQFDKVENQKFNSFNFSKGLYVFFMGLAKKVIIADSFAVCANAGYANTGTLNFLDSWITSLSYAFQLYFDFSGYSDMAIGLALLFNIHIAINFNSPYRALTIQDFWRRWHITLSNFLRDYLYIPLGGNRVSEFNTLRNLMYTFVLGGLWHGAGWTFIFWGFLHGFGQVVFKLWKKTSIEMPNWLAWFITFNYVNLAWVFFRASSWQEAIQLVEGMIGMRGIGKMASTVMTDLSIAPFLAAGLLLLFYKNPPELALEFKTDRKHFVYLLVLSVLGLLFMNSITANNFLYFDF
jgi:alginate O-acetyltransferase complex protein AlgI